MSFWFPCLNDTGVVAGGNGMVSLWNGGTIDIALGHSPQWITPLTLLVGGHPYGTVIMDRQGTVLRSVGDYNPRVGNVSGITAGAGHWCGFTPSRGLVYDDMVIDPAAAPGAVDTQTGALYYLTPYQSGTRYVVVQGKALRAAPAVDIVAGDQACCWAEYEGPARRLYGWSPETGAVNLSPLPPTEYLFVGVPVRTPAGLWVVASTHSGLMAYPWGGTQGYVYEGMLYYHHARWVQGQVRIVATNERGDLLNFAVDSAAPRRDLTRYYPTSGEPVVPPKPPKPPDPEEEPVIAPVVTVDKWTLDELKNGEEFVFHDANNLVQGYRVRVWVENGSMFAQITNAAGSAQTGARRPVRP